MDLSEGEAEDSHMEAEEFEMEDENNYDDSNDYYYDDENYYPDDNNQEANIGLAKAKQYELPDLVKIIEEEVQKIKLYTNFNSEWAQIYYAACGWKEELCAQLIDFGDKHRRLIHYNPQINEITFKGEDFCASCFQFGIIIQGLCQDQYCEQCWKQHIEYRLKNNKTEPFPPCLNSACSIKVAPMLCKYFSVKDHHFKKLFTNILCRSYATNNLSVKICKGKQGINCNQCFVIEDMFGVIQCNNCGNMVCPRCGEQSHGLCQCYDLKNWKKITENSLEFIEYLNMKICPYCGQGVERICGCNSIICRCKGQFCYICGQKWLPNHSHQGDQCCHLANNVMLLNEHKKAMKLKGQITFQKVQNIKTFENTMKNRIDLIFDIRSKMSSESIPLILDHFQIDKKSSLEEIYDICTTTMKALYFLKGWKIDLYFRPSLLQQAQLIHLKELSQKLSDFIINFYHQKVRIIQKPIEDRSVEEQSIFTEENRLKFKNDLKQNTQKMNFFCKEVEKMMQKKVNDWQ